MLDTAIHMKAESNVFILSEAELLIKALLKTIKK